MMATAIRPTKPSEKLTVSQVEALYELQFAEDDYYKCMQLGSLNARRDVLDRLEARGLVGRASGVFQGYFITEDGLAALLRARTTSEPVAPTPSDPKDTKGLLVSFKNAWHPVRSFKMEPNQWLSYVLPNGSKRIAKPRHWRIAVAAG